MENRMRFLTTVKWSMIGHFPWSRIRDRIAEADRSYAEGLAAGKSEEELRLELERVKAQIRAEKYPPEYTRKYFLRYLSGCILAGILLGVLVLALRRDYLRLGVFWCSVPILLVPAGAYFLTGGSLLSASRGISPRDQKRAGLLLAVSVGLELLDQLLVWLLFPNLLLYLSETGQFSVSAGLLSGFSYANVAAGLLYVGYGLYRYHQGFLLELGTLAQGVALICSAELYLSRMRNLGAGFTAQALSVFFYPALIGILAVLLYYAILYRRGAWNRKTADGLLP
ncbi:MAG: hypothetical protein LBQ15_11470 [Clostridium sp.]|jgi:hypothetical protein|nr:hypothetical protein [Clostridium sp.]